MNIDINEGKSNEEKENLVSETAEDTKNSAAEENTNTSETAECTNQKTDRDCESAAATDSAADEKNEQTPEEKISELEKQIAELKTQQLYKVAEFDNYRRRVAQEKSELIKNGGAQVIKTILPIVDDLERAQQNMNKYEDVAAVKEGLDLIIEKFFKLLAQEGLKKMDVVGQPFNADLHEAIASVPGLPDDQKGKVIDCVSAGYTLNDKVLRYAKVAVAAE